MGFEPTEYGAGAPPVIEDLSGAVWTPLYRKDCSFGPALFFDVMMNLVRNPNINSSWLFRADILHERDGAQGDNTSPGPNPDAGLRLAHFRDLELEKALVRRLIPRNTQRDQPLSQSCLFYRHGRPDGITRSMVVYIPHVSDPSEMPFYHPGVAGLAFLHEWNASDSCGSVSIHYHFFDTELERSPKLARTALHLLSTLHKHGQGSVAGYVKRVNHDVVVPQATMQTTYARLKEKHARKLIETWAEVTDPAKHVFEDLGIAAFLIELWAQMYRDQPFPGFVDIGCGNGLLVYILLQEGYQGWGFDARKRKSWEHYCGTADSDPNPSALSSCLRQHVLLPSVIAPKEEVASWAGEIATGNESANELVHDGLFPRDTFIISNHADELTPWTPILATISECPFIMIPCCSHDLTGARYRAPAPKQQNKSPSAYSSLVAWVSGIAAECGWEVETEMLRIPSTRNTGLIGRRRTRDYGEIDLPALIRKYGGTEGFAENVMKLVKIGPRGH